MKTTKSNPEQLLRTDDDILADIWDALWKEDALRSLDTGSLSIDVKDGEVYLDGYFNQENNLPLVVSILRSVAGVVAVHNLLRTDDGILADLWAALWKEAAIRSLDMGSLSIDVKDGEVYLYGHLARENNRLLIERIAHSIVGVVAVHNDLVTDRELIRQAAYAMGRDERTRRFTLPVNASHGWIYLGGEVPTRELQHAVEKVVGGVSRVRGVLTLPRVAGESPTPLQPAVQPRIGAVVHGRDREIGVVTQVVIHPDSRLVTHVVVLSRAIVDINLVTRETVVPVKAFDLVNQESLLLVRKGPSLNAYPAFDPDEYPLAPLTWKAPYPYTAGEVRWSSSRPSRPGLKPAADVPGSLDLVMAQAGV